MFSREQKREMLSNACNFWFVLDQKTQEDLVNGECVYSEYNCVPIIDYTRKHATFYEGAKA